MDGLEFAIRFSYIVNKLRFCGPDIGQKIFHRYLQKKDNADEVKAALKRFEGLWPYLSVIAKKVGMDFFDYEVIEAYWIGNSLLDKCDESDCKEVITLLSERGLPKSLAKKLIEGVPNGCVPNHVFNVFYVGVGNTSGKVETNLANQNNCRPSWGVVADVIGDHAVVIVRDIVMKDKKYVLGDPEPKTIIVPDHVVVKRGDCIATHWGCACMVLTKVQERNVERYTEKILMVLNKQSGTA